MRSVLRYLVALVAALPLALVAAAPAGATLTSADAITENPPPAGANAGPLPAAGKDAAGAHPNFRLVLGFSGSGGDDSVKTYDIHFAPGIVSYVNHVARCTTAQFAISDTANASTCPAGSLVGSVDTDVTVDVLGLPTPLTLSGGRVYNLEPPAGSPAALGIDIPPPATLPLGVSPLPHTKLLVTVTIDPHDLALTARVHDLPNSASGLTAHIDRIDQTLFGYVDGRSFFTNPTSCIPAPVTVTATSYGGAVSSANDSYTPTDCEHVPFSTSLTMTADPPTSDSTSTISFDVKPGAFDIPRANSHVRGTTVVAPPGVLINPALAARLDACTDDQFRQSDTSVPANCPASSAVGDISFVSPILGTFPGKAYFGSQTPTDRLRLFLDVPLYGAHIKVSAHVHPSYDTGQITTVFDDLPQIAFTDFALTFHGGPRSALVTPTTCGTNTASATLLPWSGGAAQTATASFVTSWDGRGAPCQRPFGPTMDTSVSRSRGGGNTDFTLVANRPDRNVPIGRMTYHLPAGLVGSLALRGLVQCPLSVAAAGDCPASSRLGGVRALAGSGTEPPSLPGDVYLTKPKVAGDPAGLSVKVPAKLGPVDAGVVIVGARLVLRPDGGLDAISDSIPAFQLGIPLAMRQLTVTVDRDGFMRNPTSCGEKTAFGHFDSIGSEHADASSKLHFTDCDRLGFGPRLRAFIGARHRTGVGSHPPFTTVITTKGDDATIRSAHVRLPKGIASNTRSLNAACATDAFAAGRCPAQSQVARAVALSPLLRDPVTGPVYLVKRPAGQPGLPRLVVQFRTPIAFELDGAINIGKRGLIGTTFPVVPDLPLTRFTLRFHGGAYGALALTRNICRGALRFPAAFTGQNGKVLKARPRIAVRGCAKHRHHHRRAHRKH
jgi:hypothetical protein